MDTDVAGLKIAQAFSVVLPLRWKCGAVKCNMNETFFRALMTLARCHLTSEPTSEYRKNEMQQNTESIRLIIFSLHNWNFSSSARMWNAVNFGKVNIFHDFNFILPSWFMINFNLNYGVSKPTFIHVRKWVTRINIRYIFRTFLDLWLMENNSHNLTFPTADYLFSRIMSKDAKKPERRLM